MNMRTKTKTWVALLIVFLSGAVIGFFSGQIYLDWRVRAIRRAGPEALQRFLMMRLKSDLRLRADQIPAVEEVINRTVQDMDVMRRRHGAEIQERMERALSDLRPELDSKQQTTLDSIRGDRLLPGPEHKPPD